jgi:iron-sulfur cluster assembly protein
MITISQQAKGHLIAMLNKTNMAAVELGLEPQGCNGFKYTWTAVATSIGDHVIELDEEYRLIISESNWQRLDNSEIILEASRMGNRLVVNNPQVDASCGCGESVNFKNV